MLAEQGQSGLHDLLANGSSAFSEINNLVTSQSANLGCVLHDAADILTNLAQPANLNNLSQGLAYNTYFFGAVDKIAVAGNAKAPTKNSPPDQNQVFLRTRLLLPPILSEQGVSYATANSIPDTLPGAGCNTVFGQGVGPATQAGFTPAAGGHLIKPSAAGGQRRAQRRARPSRSATPRTGCPAAAPACCSPWAAWSSRSCSWPGAPARPAGARGGGPDKPHCPLVRGQAGTRTEATAGPRHAHAEDFGGNMHMRSQTVERGVKVVGAVPDDETTTDKTDETARADRRLRDAARRGHRPAPPGAVPAAPSPARAARPSASSRVVAALGLLGTLVFGVLYATKSSGQIQDPAVLSASRTFLTDFFNFTPKTVDSDFNAITAMATGQFSSQANAVLQLEHPQALETAARLVPRPGPLPGGAAGGQPAGDGVDLRGRRPDLRQQQVSSLGSDVVRLTADLEQVNGIWKISNVTVLEGATPASASGNSGSGSAGSSVPGQ